MTADTRRATPFASSAEAIDNAARVIATSVGLTSITLRRVVSTSGLTPGEVSAAEPSMNALAARTFNDLAREELARIVDQIAVADTPLASLKLLVAALLGADHDLSKTIWADAWSVARHNELLAEAAASIMTAWQHIVVELILAGIQSGEFTAVSEEPELLSQWFFALIDSTTAYGLVGYLDSARRARMVTRSLEVGLGLDEGVLCVDHR